MSERNDEFPSGWVSVPFGELCTFAQNGCSTRRSASGLPTVVLRLADVSTDGRIAGKNLREIKLSEQDRQKYALKRGDLLAYRVNGSPRIAGQVIHYLGPDGYAFCDHFIRFRTDNTALDPEFASLAFRVPAVRQLIEARMVSSAGQNTVSQSSFAEISFPLPPLAEQRRIVAKIEVLQARNRQAREALVEVGPLLEQFRQSVLAAAFRGDLTTDWRATHPNVEPASELLDRIRAERRRHWEENELAKYRSKGKEPKDDKWKQQYKEAPPLEYSNLPEIPQSWEWVNWSTLTIWVTYGFTRPMPHVDTGRMIVTAKNVKNTGLDLTETHFTTETAFEQLSPKDRPLPGDILIIKDGATTGRATLVPEDISGFCINQSVAVVWLKHSSMNRQFLLRWIQAPFIQRQIQLAMAGNAMPHLSITDFARMPLPVPPLEEQQEICERMEECLRSSHLLEETFRTIIGRLDQLDQSILAKAFRGELVPQDPNDEPASVLLARILEQRTQQAETAKCQKKTAMTQRANKTGKESARLTPQQLTLAELL